MSTLHRTWRICAFAALAVASVVLTGCATSRQIDSSVRSFAGPTPVVSGATYRFERLLSQTDASQQPLEAAAERWLTAKGLVRSETPARYAVQVRLEVDPVVPDRPYRWPSAAFGDRVVVAADGSLWRQVRRPVMEASWYRNTLQVVVRDSAAGSVAFETRAVFEGPWSDTANLIDPLMQAALADFPLAAPTAKTITVELPASSEVKR